MADTLIFNLVRRLKRRWSKEGMAALTQAEVDEINAVLADWKRGQGAQEAATAPRRTLSLGTAANAVSGAGEAPAAVQEPIRTVADLTALLSNRNAPALTGDDFARVADELGVSEKMIRAVRKVEAPRGPFDDHGRPSILYERHVFRRNTNPKGKFDATAPLLSGPPYGRGGYGSFESQYTKLAEACRLDQDAAFKACSWGAFQVLGENAESLGYESAFAMAKALTVSEAAHLDSFVRYVKENGLVEKLRQCRAGDPASCIPFVERYNGAGFRQFDYHKKLADAAL